jgi:hypothetical protein
MVCGSEEVLVKALGVKSVVGPFAKIFVKVHSLYVAAKIN